MDYKVLAVTTKMTNEDWLALRGGGIGGSDAGIIMGYSRWKSPFTLWAEKSGLVKNEFKGNKATSWGHRLELPVAEQYAEENNRAVVSWNVMLQSTRWEFMKANLDFLIVKPSEKFPAGVVTQWDEKKPPEDILAILEIKTAGIVGRGGIGEWDNEGVPRLYELQGCHYSAVTGIPRVVFGALVAGEGLLVRGRLYEEDDLNELVGAELEFWEHVQNGTPVNTDSNNDTFQTIKTLHPKSEEGTAVEANAELANVFFEWQRAKDKADEAEKIATELRAKLLLAIGNAEALQYNGETLFTYKSTKAGEELDVKALMEAHPELVAQFQKPKAGYRVLRPNRNRL